MRLDLAAIAAGMGLALAPWVGLQPAVAATIVYTNEADFLSALGGLPMFLNEFANSDYFGWLAHPIQASANGISYSIVSQPPARLVGFDGVLCLLSDLLLLRI